jgi:peptidoglycan hydrolase-like protein with peptidoglycan-binding domain
VIQDSMAPRTPRHAAARLRRTCLLATLLVGLIVDGLSAPGVVGAIGGAAYPVQSLEDRGTDVATIQALLRHHLLAPRSLTSGGRTVVVRGVNPIVPVVDGRFGETTRIALQGFQLRAGLAVTGIADAGTWARLAIPLSAGSTAEAVAAVQRQLIEKHGAVLPVDGVYGTTTTAAVKAFQAHAGLAQTGAMDAVTWRNLVWHFELPRFSGAALCDYSVGNGPANWGTGEMVAVLEAAGAVVVGAGYGRAAIGDVGFEHGGDIPGHETHEVGLDADVRPMRQANDQCALASTWRLTAYDRAATRVLAQAIRAAAPGHVKAIFFNDPVLIAEGLTTFNSGHDDHLHVRICEAWHVDPRYRC